MDCKKYNAMEHYLHTINQRYIALSEEEEIRNNAILRVVVEPIIQKMQEKDKLFKKLYKDMFFGGSYYDGLKIGSPNEYDLDLLLKFPPPCETEICNINEVDIYTSNKPGFVNLYLRNRNGFGNLCEFWQAYLDIPKLLSWMEGVIQKALNDFNEDRSWYIFQNLYSQKYYVKVYKQGPAFTLIIRGENLGQLVNLSIDLVPCFSFDYSRWPKNGFKPNPFSYNTDMSDFFVVPKYPKGVPNYGGRYWRLSFQKQERYLIHNKGRLKPALKLLKKMRDTMNSNQISSYYLKTVVLWDAEKQDPNFWLCNSLSYVFMYILKTYQKCLSDKKIPYFWNKKYNLLESVSGDLNNMSNRLKYIIDDIDRNVSQNPAVVLKYVLTPDEQKALFPEVPIEESSWCSLL
uniref:Uncharacterized protein n=1 Tax=Anoplophora glabripennis TaxID=217634 RepID=V5H2F2_ANOGL